MRGFTEQNDNDTSAIGLLSRDLKRLDCPTALIVITKDGNVYVTDNDTMKIAEKMVQIAKKDLMLKA